MLSSNHLGQCTSVLMQSLIGSNKWNPDTWN